MFLWSNYYLTYHHCVLQICDATNVETRHDIKYAIDGIGRRWWQSPTINNGYNYNWVTISLDLKQVRGVLQHFVISVYADDTTHKVDILLIF